MTYTIEQIEALRAGITSGEKFATAYPDDLFPPENSEKCWTISSSSDETGWENDANCSGYGLIRKEAEFYAASPAIVDTLLAEREKLLEENERLTKEVERMKAERADSEFNSEAVANGALVTEINDLRLYAKAAEDVARQWVLYGSMYLPEQRQSRITELIEARIAELKGCERKDRS